MRSHRTRSRLWLWAIPICLIAGMWFFSGRILRATGSLFVKDAAPVRVDLIVVLGGDGSGGRILKGAELAREGFAPAVLVCGGEASYGYTESDLATDFAVRHGYARDLFIVPNWQSLSTTEEAHNVIRELHNRHAYRAMIVTTLWHTARAGRVYRRLAPDITFDMVGSDDPNWRHGDWWVDRQGRKTFFMEGVKTIADFLRI